MFNNENYQRRLDEIKEDIRAMVVQFDQANLEFWQKDVSLRYGRFLAARGAEQLGRAIDAFDGYDHVDDKQKHREYCAAELMGTVAAIHAASSLIRGAVVGADCIGAEAMMRIYAEANPPVAAKPVAPGSTAPAPMIVETDASYREAIRPMWPSRNQVHYSESDLDCLAGHSLDVAGRSVGVLRTTAPAS